MRLRSRAPSHHQYSGWAAGGHFQAATQIHEQTLTFVPKLIVIALVLLALGSWMSKVMNEFVVELFAIMAAL